MTAAVISSKIHHGTKNNGRPALPTSRASTENLVIHRTASDDSFERHITCRRPLFIFLFACIPSVRQCSLRSFRSPALSPPWSGCSIPGSLWERPLRYLGSARMQTRTSGVHRLRDHISGTAEAKVVKFCMLVGYVKSQHNDDKSPLTKAWSGSRDPL